MELDRQSIERRDFPISRRGYDPGAVDAHLRVLAAEVEELERSLDSRGGESLGSAAGSQVQSILEAAEATAADIERLAAEQGRSTRELADREAQRTRSEAVARAQEHVQAVSQATAVLLERVESIDGEVSALVQSLRAGAGRLAVDLRAVEKNMGELYDAAAGTDAVGEGVQVESTSFEPEPVAPEPAPAAPAARAPASRATPARTATAQGAAGSKIAANGSEQIGPITSSPGQQTPTSQQASGGSGDQDGARLIALNMALNGEPREQTDRYLSEHFALSDRAKLLDEVYAAIEG